MSSSKSSKQWLQEHFTDIFVKKSKAEGYRSRAAYKLLEIQDKDKILNKKMTVIDLGAAPGSWSQIASKIVGDNGRVIALDILLMDAIANVQFIQGDFREAEVLNKLINVLGNSNSDVILSDMAPNMSGMRQVDQPKAIYLAELAFDMALQILAPRGSLVVKLFQGLGFDQYLGELRKHFDKVTIRKPKASRSRSTEVYIVAKGFYGASAKR